MTLRTSTINQTNLTLLQPTNAQDAHEPSLASLRVLCAFVVGFYFSLSNQTDRVAFILSD
ncbi:MAG: hypothetical protein KME06_08010 [Kastovskya adunca ATA6-11-RM4]|nr:hypothetical protein [Kastovskya adunca ATA6-11-RM4]